MICLGIAVKYNEAHTKNSVYEIIKQNNRTGYMIKVENIYTKLRDQLIKEPNVRSFIFYQDKMKIMTKMILD